MRNDDVGSYYDNVDDGPHGGKDIRWTLQYQTEPTLRVMIPPQRELYAAIVAYARQFHVPITERETIEGWFARIAPGLERKSNGVTFLALLRAFVVAATGVSDDELDALVQKNRPDPTPQVDPMPIHSSPSSPLRCKCGDPQCAGGASPTRSDPLGQRQYDPVPITGASSTKDSLLNPKPKGFVGASKLPYDSDVD